MRVRSASMVLATVALAAATGCTPSREEPSTLTGSPTSTTVEQPTETTATGTSQPAPDQQVITVTVANGTVTPAPAPVDVALGSVVAIEVIADVTDEIHVHGYDITQPITAGQPARVEVQATVPGQFEVELESAHLLLVELRVR